MKWRWWKTAQEIRDEVIQAIEDKKQAEINERNNEPWVDIKGIVEDPKHGIRVDLDWNEAFVEYLRENGITGVDEEVVVQKWITMLYRDLIEQNQQADGAQREFE
jgi:hypothetical protein